MLESEMLLTFGICYARKLVLFSPTSLRIYDLRGVIHVQTAKAYAAFRC